VRRRRCQVCASIRRIRLSQFTKCGRSNDYAITLDKGQIRGDDNLRSGKRSTHNWRRVFIQEPTEDCARFGVQVHRWPRSSSRSSAALRRPRRARVSATYKLASPGEPRVTRPLLASPSRAAGTDASASPRPGGESSAITSPRSVTSTLSPERTWRRYSLNRFFSSRMPTVFMNHNVAS
jgi:hypothetical protein